MGAATPAPTPAAPAPAAAAAAAAPAPRAASRPAFRLAFVLDITGSMGSQMKGVKAATGQLVDLAASLPGLDLSFAVITYCENSSACFASLAEFEGGGGAAAAHAYVAALQLCQPPDAPQVKANGGDGPENLKAGPGELPLCALVLGCAAAGGSACSWLVAQAARSAQPAQCSLPGGRPAGSSHYKCPSKKNTPRCASPLQAALVRLAELQPSPPTIAFVITDASPHLRKHGAGSEAAAELAWLAERGLPAEVARDAFRTFVHVAERFGGSLVLNVVAYSNVAETLSTLGALAAATGGLLLRPAARDPALLARGMLAVVRSLAAQLQPAAAAPAAVGEAGADEAALLQGFELLDAAAAAPRASEDEPEGPAPAAGDASELFACAMARMCQVCGTKWSKRALGMAAPCEQLQFVWSAARLLARAAGAPGLPPLNATALDAELVALGTLRCAILDALPPESRGHFSLGERDVWELVAAAARLDASGGCSGAAAGEAAAAAAAGAASCISLATVGDALAEEADWEDWLASVGRLLQGWPARLALPLDREGRPDFMDAWRVLLGCWAGPPYRVHA